MRPASRNRSCRTTHNQTRGSSRETRSTRSDTHAGSYNNPILRKLFIYSMTLGCGHGRAPLDPDKTICGVPVVPHHVRLMVEPATQRTFFRWIEKHISDRDPIPGQNVADAAVVRGGGTNRATTLHCAARSYELQLIGRLQSEFSNLYVVTVQSEKPQGHHTAIQFLGNH